MPPKKAPLFQGRQLRLTSSVPLSNVESCKPILHLSNRRGQVESRNSLAVRPERRAEIHWQDGEPAKVCHAPRGI